MQTNCTVDNKTRLNSHLRTSSLGLEQLRSTSCASSSREQTSRGSCIRPRNFDRTQENSANVTKAFVHVSISFDLQSILASMQLIQRLQSIKSFSIQLKLTGRTPEARLFNWCTSFAIIRNLSKLTRPSTRESLP